MDSVDISVVCFCMNNTLSLKKLRKTLLMDVNITILTSRFYTAKYKIRPAYSLPQKKQFKSISTYRNADSGFFFNRPVQKLN